MSPVRETVPNNVDKRKEVKELMEIITRNKGKSTGAPDNMIL